jgi:hypothetical protein
MPAAERARSHFCIKDHYAANPPTIFSLLCASSHMPHVSRASVAQVTLTHLTVPLIDTLAGRVLVLPPARYDYRYTRTHTHTHTHTHTYATIRRTTASVSPRFPCRHKT